MPPTQLGGGDPFPLENVLSVRQGVVNLDPVSGVVLSRRLSGRFQRTGQQRLDMQSGLANAGGDSIHVVCHAHVASWQGNSPVGGLTEASPLIATPGSLPKTMFPVVRFAVMGD